MCKLIMFPIILFISLICTVNCAKILGIFQMSAYSHYALGNALLKGLAAKGHDVTMIAAYEEKENLTNYHNVVVPEIIEFSKDFNLMEMKNLSIIDNLYFISNYSHTVTDLTLKNTNVQKLLKSNEKFDVMIMEQFLSEALTGFQYHYNIPCVLFSTIRANIWVNSKMGNPQNPSYVEDIFGPYVGSMTFFQRFYNTFLYLINNFVLMNVILPSHDELMHKYFPNAPKLTDLIYNTSLVLLNSHSSISSPVSLLPNMIEIAGLHINTKQLPEDIKTYLDESPEGVIYFSLGSNLKSKDIDPRKRDAIINVFTKLKMKILWKFEDESLIPKVKNIKIYKWMPQQEILSHPNVKLFITHGGFLSTTETLYFGKPLLGIPFFGDQKMNMELAVNSGYGLSLDYEDLTVETFSRTLNELLSNPRYTEIAQWRSAAFRDQPESPLDRAIYWVEYVVRNKGAYHLRSNALNLHWHQYLLLDIITFVILCLLSIILVLYMSVKLVLRLFSKIGKSNNINVKKNN